MYNSDGSLRVRTERSAGAKGSLNLSWEAEAIKEKENNAKLSQSPKASPKAAGRRTKVTHITDTESPLKPNQRPGSDARARDNKGNLAAEEEAGVLPCRISDAKKKALYESRVFNAGSGTPEPLASELSKLKMQEVAGHDIFNQHEAPQEERRNVLGGVRKDPGGGSSLRMDNLHPSTPLNLRKEVIR